MPPDVDLHIHDSDDHITSCWDRSSTPVATIQSGDVVQFECRDAHNGQISRDSTVDELPHLNSDPIHPLTGPIEVETATAGDTLQVDLLDISHKGFGYTLFYAESKGLLPEEFDKDGLYIWDLEGDTAHFTQGIEVPVDPFPGVIGVTPDKAGPQSTMPPRSVGGNLDVKHLSSGSTVLLPVEVDGALFSIGDCHAAQGDGEVCVTGIEAPMTVTARLTVRSDVTVSQPRFRTSHPFTAKGTDEPMIGTTGIASDLFTASKHAIRDMLEYLTVEHDLDKGEAYMLCSAAVDLKINEIVNEPNYAVSAYLPESIFPYDVESF